MSDPAAAGGHQKRDLRIDFFRGLALYVILIDHIGANPLGRYTYHRFGFSDAAEVFIFLSGLTCGIVYHSMLARRGPAGLVAALLKRVTLIYVFYVLSSVATIWFIHTNADAILQSDMLHDSFAPFAGDFLAAAKSAILLTKQPSLPGILVLYMALTLVVMPAFLLGARYAAALVVAVSGCIWLISQFYIPGPTWTHLFPYFNPLAWQFLFSIGMYFGVKYHSTAQSAQRTASARWLLTVAWAILAFSLLYRVLPLLASKVHFELDWYHPYDPSDHKYNLSVLRLAHFLAIAVLVRYYVRQDNLALNWGGGCIIEAGKRSLQIFSMGAVLSEVGTVVFAIYSPSVSAKLAFNAGAMLLTALVAIAFANFKSRSGSIDATPDSGKITMSAEIGF